MTGQCCPLHTTTCGHLDYCCDDCPAERESLPKQLVAALLGALLLILGWVAVA